MASYTSPVDGAESETRFRRDTHIETTPALVSFHVPKRLIFLVFDDTQFESLHFRTWAQLTPAHPPR